MLISSSFTLLKSSSRCFYFIFCADHVRPFYRVAGTSAAISRPTGTRIRSPSPFPPLNVPLPGLKLTPAADSSSSIARITTLPNGLRVASTENNSTPLIDCVALHGHRLASHTHTLSLITTHSFTDTLSATIRIDSTASVYFASTAVSLPPLRLPVAQASSVPSECSSGRARETRRPRIAAPRSSSRGSRSRYRAAHLRAYSSFLFVRPYVDVHARERRWKERDVRVVMMIMGTVDEDADGGADDERTRKVRRPRR